jgi:hypothetical protein
MQVESLFFNLNAFSSGNFTFILIMHVQIRILTIIYSILGVHLSTKLPSQVVNSGISDTISGSKLGSVSIGGYIDSYYSYHFNQPENGEVPYFVSMNRHNEVTINLAMLDFRYNSERIRARFAPGFGSYMNANYASEIDGMKNLVEANAGVRIFKNKDIWIDFGILGSPYTNESCISRDHLMYTRSLAPEYVPYYLSGAKVSVPVHNKWNLYFYILNGWQQITDQNKAKSLGMQVEFRPNSTNLINWDFYAGNERSDDFPENRMRYFTDIYWIYNPDGRFSLTSCAYVGVQYREVPQHNHKALWWQFNLIGRYRVTKNTSLAVRFEYFNDSHAAQIRNIVSVSSGFKATGGGLCFNHHISDNALFRLEGRYLHSMNESFKSSNGDPLKSSTSLTGNLTVWF